MNLDQIKADYEAQKDMPGAHHYLPELIAYLEKERETNIDYLVYGLGLGYSVMGVYLAIVANLM